MKYVIFILQDDESVVYGDDAVSLEQAIAWVEEYAKDNIKVGVAPAPSQI